MEKILDNLRNLTRMQIIIGIIGMIVVIIIVTAILMIGSGWDLDGDSSLPIYFFNASAGRLDAELQPRPQGGDAIELVRVAMGHLMNDPKDTSNLARTWPEGLEFLEFVIGIHMDAEIDNMLVLTFSDHYRNMSPLNEALFRAALTLTMVGIPYIESVKIRWADDIDEYGTILWDERIESRGTIANDPSIPSTRISTATFTLFFIDESGEGLVTEVYAATDIDHRRRGASAIERLIEGPSNSDFSPAVRIPPETRVRSVNVVPAAGAVYVDLSSEFLTNFSGTPAQARLMIASIVNTLNESIVLGGLRTYRFFFLIDSTSREDFHGVSGFNLSFSFDETVMLGYGAPDESEYDYEPENGDE